MDTFENSWFYGRKISKFTATNDLFLRFPNVTHWKFEVVCSFETISSVSAFNFGINQLPSNGSCQINPKNGTTSTLFTVTCSDWQMKDKIKEYSLYITSRQIIAFSPISFFQVRLSVGNHLNLFVRIPGIMNGITEYNLSSITVISESISLSEQSFIELLSSGNQNTIGQVITLLTDKFNRIHNEMIEKAIRDRIALTSISIPSLGTRLNIPNSRIINESARLEFLKEINRVADLRGYFVQLTNRINQLT